MGRFRVGNVDMWTTCGLATVSLCNRDVSALVKENFDDSFRRIGMTQKSAISGGRHAVKAGDRSARSSSADTNSGPGVASARPPTSTPRNRAASIRSIRRGKSSIARKGREVAADESRRCAICSSIAFRSPASISTTHGSRAYSLTARHSFAAACSGRTCRTPILPARISREPTCETHCC